MKRDHEGGNRSQTREASLRPAPGGTLKNFVRLLALLGLATAALLPLSVSAQAQSDSSGEEGLESAVVEAMGVESNTTARSFATVQEEGRTQVNVMREGAAGDWTFGSAVIEAPKKRGHYPKGWLFVAEDSGEGWNVALEGSPEFSNLASEAPEGVVSKGEKQTFSRQPTSASRTTQALTPTGLRLPWLIGRAWYMTGGPHGWNTGYDRPYAALDFAGIGRDQGVRASGAGRIYTMCANRLGWIRILHNNGYSTDYYHLFGNIKPRNGSFVKTGAVLGLTGNNVSCGGASYGRHVHFALLRGNTHIPVHDKIIGGWIFKQGQAYGGYAKRGQVNRFPGSFIRNFGP